MSGQNVFEKRYVDPKDQSKIEGLLELFNLPPQVISFLRQHKRAVQVGLAVVAILIVAGSLYTSYREKKIEAAASALAVALKETDSEQKGALRKVAEDYKGTSSAIWARVELAHIAMKAKDYVAASAGYSAIHKEVKPDNPLYALSLFGMAQADEAQGKTDAAYAAFEQLKDLEGYQLTGYTGMARIHEEKGELEKALGIYGQYLAVIGDSAEAAGQKALVEERIAQIKARK